MNKFRLLGIVFLILLLALIGSVQAQDATEEPTPTPEVTAVATVVIEQPPVVVVDSGPSEDHLTWRELGLYALVAVAVTVLGVVAYRLTTMVGNSYPPGTSAGLERAREKGREFVASTPNLIDDVGLYVSEPLIDAVIKAIKEREKAASIDDGTAVG